MGDNDKPRRFKAGESFYIDLTFEKPLPQGAYPLVNVTGPIDNHDLMQTSFGTGSSMNNPDAQHIRVSGNVPPTASPGTYKVIQLRIGWTVGSPPNWQPVELDFSHLGEDATIIVDPSDHPPQPPIPPLTDLD